MKLFGTFKAVKMPEENAIFVSNGNWLYYIYNPRHKQWHQYRNAGNVAISVKNYPDVSLKELTESLGGVFPDRETVFMRACNPRELNIGNIWALLAEDFPSFMKDCEIDDSVYKFLLESVVRDVSYRKLNELFENAKKNNLSNEAIVQRIRELSLSVIGRDIFNDEIGIVDGHDGSSYFWIMPVRIVEDAHDGYDAILAEMSNCEISIEEDDVSKYLTHFLFRYFDQELKANKERNVEGFEWYLTNNFFTFDSVEQILGEIRETIEILLSEKDNEFSLKLRKDRAGTEKIIDFYNRFLYRMEYMMKVGKEKGYDLISFMGP